ncbi:CBS domain-containing protein [Actinoplanes sp. NPDC049548]|uniref:CBS domain-containing protein n=1 Tax=Actinoplanes sp. NPDC049548 TaxID=3155152 RepID=UPI0034284244
MKQWTVRDVMTNQVLTVAAAAEPADALTTITTHDVSALAVVDDFDVVIGVLTRTDLLEAMTWRQDRARSRLPWRRRRQPALAWSRATVRDMMTAPAVTVAPDATPARAARLMHRAGVKRLLVTDHLRRLVGIVAAADLLTIFGRSDEDVEADVRALLQPVGADAVQVGVHDGVATLTGRVPDQATERLLHDLTRAAPGVADVVADLHVQPGSPAPNRPGEAAGHRPHPLDAWWLARRPGRPAVARVPSAVR